MVPFQNAVLDQILRSPRARVSAAIPMTRPDKREGFKITWSGIANVAPEQFQRNHDYTMSKSVPLVNLTRVIAHDRSLAIVGGGPSIKSQLPNLRLLSQHPKWDIWAINGTKGYLTEHGIHSTYVSIDSAPATEPELRGGGGALVSTTVDRSVIDYYLPHVEAFPLESVPGPTSAGVAMTLSTFKGYQYAELFGVESCYPNEQTHAFKQEDFRVDWDWLHVEADGQTYLTIGEFLIQAEWMARLVRAMPRTFINRSGGLLQALINDPDYVITAISPHLAKNLKETPDA